MARSIATLNISLNGGLFKIPLKVYPFTRDEPSPLHNACPSGHRITMKKWCNKCGREIKNEELMKVFEISENIRIKINPAVIKELKEKHKRCEFLQTFKGRDKELGLITAKAYWLGAVKGFEDFYYVLLETMKRTDYKALIKFAIRDRTNLGVIEYFNGILVLRQLRYAENFGEKPELRDYQASPELVEQMEQLLDGLGGARRVEDYQDEYAKELLEMVKDNPEQIGEDSVKVKEDALKNALAVAISSMGKKKGEEN